MMTSKGMPFVSGTFKYTKIHDIIHPTTNNPNTPVRPRSCSKKGNEEVMINVHIQYVREQMEIHIPRTLVGNISEHKMFGITPKPMQNTLSYVTTLIAVIAALSIELR